MLAQLILRALYPTGLTVRYVPEFEQVVKPCCVDQLLPRARVRVVLVPDAVCARLTRVTPSVKPVTRQTLSVTLNSAAVTWFGRRFLTY